MIEDTLKSQAKVGPGSENKDSSSDFTSLH